MSSLRLRAAVACAASMLAFAFDGRAEDRAWVIAVPDGPGASYHGLASFDGAGTDASAMLYPVPSLIALPFVVLAHGLIVEGAKSSQKSSIQQAADKVLGPYKPVIDSMTMAGLVGDGARRLSTPGEKRLAPRDQAGNDGFLLETLPVYAMTQDERAILIDNVVRVYKPGARETPEFAGIVRVVSTPLPKDITPSDYWLKDDGKRMRDLSAELWAESVDIGLGEWSAPHDGPEKTYRYAEGAAERMERAKLLREVCGHLVVKTLRGEFLSIPKRGPLQACDPHIPQAPPAALDATPAMPVSAEPAPATPVSTGS